MVEHVCVGGARAERLRSDGRLERLGRRGEAARDWGCDLRQVSSFWVVA